jgi:hypothetical protein
MAVRNRLVPLALALSVAVLVLPVRARAAEGQRVDLTVLVVIDNGAAAQGIAEELDVEGVPHVTVDLRDSHRPTIDDAFLSDTVDTGPRAKFQAVVLPNENPFGAGSAELAALARFEKTFGVRQIDAYTYANPAVGLHYASNPGYIGSLDATTAQLTPAARTGPWSYLRGQVPFDADAGSYGYLAVPLADDPATGSHFEPYVTEPIPGTSATGALAGVYSHDGREELVLTFSSNFFGQYFRLLAHGLVTWMTKGVHLGYHRNYFAVHVDDLFLGNNRWSHSGHCTPNSGDCAPSVPSTTPVRMTPADEAFAKSWQTTHAFTFDFLFNAYGHDKITGPDPLTDALITDRASFRWVNHAYSHPFLGCVRDFSSIPWRCTTDATSGAVNYASQADIVYQVSRNIAWAHDHGLAIDPAELVTGEHGGLRILPPQPADNPNLAPALQQTGITWLGSDSSREATQRQLGPALTLPRYPLEIYYNAGTKTDEVSEYNWTYTSKANGGAGSCERSSVSTCIAPLDPTTGYDSYIVPVEVRKALRHILTDDVRPHYVHQSNLAEDRLLYPVLDSVFASYAAMFADNSPLVDLRLRDLATQLRRQTTWAGTTASAYVLDGQVSVRAPAGVDVPITVPEGANGANFGDPYGGERSAYISSDGSPITLTYTE